MFIMGMAVGVIFLASSVVFQCDRTHNTDEWSYGIQKDAVNFLFHHRWCCMCCKTKFVMTKAQLVKQELKIRLDRYDRGLEERRENRLVERAELAEKEAEEAALKAEQERVDNEIVGDAVGGALKAAQVVCGQRDCRGRDR